MAIHQKRAVHGILQQKLPGGDSVKQEDIKAKFENGILKLSVPKEEAQPKVEENKYIAIEG
mgnify:CR=1 FL=1